MIYDSPEYMEFETQHQFLEGVKKGFNLQNDMNFLSLSQWFMSKYLGIFPKTLGQTTQSIVILLKSLSFPISPRNRGVEKLLWKNSCQCCKDKKVANKLNQILLYSRI